MTAMDSVSDELRAAFRSTLFEFNSDLGPGSLRIGLTDPVAAALIRRHAAIGAAYLTAENPMGRRISDDDNAARMRELDALLQPRHVRPCIVFAGVGRAPDDSWHEASILIVGLSQPEVDALADRFEQAAYVWADQEGRATLRVRAGEGRYETDRAEP